MPLGKHYYIRSQLHGMVLEVEGGSPAPGARVIVYHQKPDDDSQLWYTDAITGTIRSKVNDFCLDVGLDSLVVNPFDPNSQTQQLQFSSSQIHSRSDPNLVADIAEASMEAGARVCMWENHHGPNQMWTEEHAQPSFFYIRSYMNDKVLDVREGNAAPGEKAIMYSKHSQVKDNQLWYEDEFGVIRSKLNDFALDVVKGSARLFPYDPASPTQQWVMDGNKISNRLNPEEVLDIYDEDSWNGAKLVPYKYHGKKNQLWHFDYL